MIVSQEDQSERYSHRRNRRTLEGVYCINQGYAVFRRIEVLDQNEEYAIVSKKYRLMVSLDMTTLYETQIK